jgi:excisionase family DNA binding protein
MSTGADNAASLSPIPDPANDAAAEAVPGTLPAILTVDELATLLRLDRKTVYDAIARGEIPGVRRIRRTLRVSRDAVLEWFAQGQGRVPRSSRSQRWP